MLEVRLIGKFEIRRDGHLVRLSSRAAQSLFAYLILTAGTLHRREKLAGMLWPDESEEKARTYLRNELWRIRKALFKLSNSEYLLADNLTIEFDQSAAYWLDVDKLKNLSEPSSTEDLIQSLSNYQGELLPGFYDDWVVVEREHLQVLFEQKVACLLEILEKEQRWNDLIKWAERWISLGQAPEEAYQGLMLAYDALGDHAKVTSTYERCKQALHQLDLEPSEQTRALVFKRNSKIKVPISLTSFIGREKELKEVAGLFSKSRLITLTGSGGVGKTRLAIQLVPEILDLFPEGVWFLDLAPLSDRALVPNTLASLIGLRESGEIAVTDLLINYFHSRRALVIFDNCEHIIDSCAQLINLLLTSCENLAILATSREKLRVAGEISYRIPSLETPKPNTKFNILEISSIEAIKLFAERVPITPSSFVLSQQNVEIIAQICQRLDGIPLALELAAARMNILTPEQVLKRLDDRFDLLTTGLRSALPRHQTLRATIEWSYELLSDKERVLFQQLAVFSGGWTLDAAEKVCAGINIIASDEVLEIISQLVNKSLVITEKPQDETRYRMLETIRQYANEQLIKSGESDLLRDIHLDYYLNLAETAEPNLISSEQLYWLPLLDADYENLRIALEWALSKEKVLPSLNLCRALGWFWVIRCYWLEGLNWLARALAKRIQDVSLNEKIARVRALFIKAYLEGKVGNIDQILLTAESSLALALEVSNRRDIAIAKSLVGNALIGRGGEDDRARSLLEQSFAELQTLDEPFWQLWCYHELGLLLARQGELKFRELRLMSLELARKAGERIALAEALLYHADWLFIENQMDEARKHAEEANLLYKQIDPVNPRKNSLLFAKIAWSNGDLQRAKSLFLEMLEHFSLLKEPYWTCICLGDLGLVVIEEGDLRGGQLYLEQALKFARESGIKDLIATGLTHLSTLSYLQGNIEQFKQSFKESLSLRDYINKAHKAYILVTILGALYFQKPESSAQLLGVIDNYEKEGYFPLTPVEKRYCFPAEVHARKMLGDTVFKFAFAVGQKMSLDEGWDLALRTVEEM